MLTEKVKETIRLAADKEEECCGLIIFKKDFLAFPCRNMAEDKQNFFSIDPFDYVRADATGEIIGCYHSHLKDNPIGEMDRQFAHNFSIPYVVYIKPKDQFELFLPDDYVNPYIGRSYEIGKSDCYSLFKEYYQGELSIDLPNFKRGPNWEEETPRLFEDNYPKHGFFEVPVAQVSTGDGILFKYKEASPACHIGIYLGDGTFLHHPPGRFSLIEPYNNAYKRRTEMIIRWHNS